MRKRFQVLAALAALLLALSGCGGGEQLAEVTAAPARTMRPLFTSTTTPTATIRPSDTPLPTETPVRTETPLPPSDTPPPTETPAPAPTALPEPTKAPEPTAPPPPTARPTNPTTPPTATATAKPQFDFRVAEIVAFEDGSLTVTGLHNIYFTVLAANGDPLNGIILEEVNNQPPLQVTTGDKGPGKTEFTMWAGDYRFKVVGNTGGQAFSSETTHILSIVFQHAVWEDLIAGGICTDATSCLALGPMHYSYNVTFRRSW
jgi:hypothetical protein